MAKNNFIWSRQPDKAIEGKKLRQWGRAPVNISREDVEAATAEYQASGGKINTFEENEKSTNAKKILLGIDRRDAARNFSKY